MVKRRQKADKSNYLNNFAWMVKDLLKHNLGGCVRVVLLGVGAVFFQILSIVFLWLFVRQLDGISELATLEDGKGIFKQFRWAFFILGIVLAMILENILSYRSSIAGFSLWKDYTKYCSKRGMIILASFPLPGKVELNKFVSGRNFSLLASKYPLSMGIASRLVVLSIVDIIQILIYSLILIYVSLLTFIVIVALSVVFVATMYRQNIVAANLSKEAEQIAGDALKEKIVWIKKVQSESTARDRYLRSLKLLFEKGKAGKYSDTLVDSFASIKKGEMYLSVLVSFSLGMALYIVFYYAYLGTASWAVLIIMILVLKNLLSLGRKLGTSVTSINRHYSQISKYIRFVILSSAEESTEYGKGEKRQRGGFLSLQSKNGFTNRIYPGKPTAIVGPWARITRSILFPLYGSEQTAERSAFPITDKVLLCPSLTDLNTAEKIFEYFPMLHSLEKEDWRRVIALYRYDYYEELPENILEFLNKGKEALHPNLVSAIVLCLITISDYMLIVVDGRIWNRVWDSRIKIFVEANKDKYLFAYYNYRWADLKKGREQEYLLMVNELLKVTDIKWIMENRELLEEYMLERELVNFEEFNEFE